MGTSNGLNIDESRLAQNFIDGVDAALTRAWAERSRLFPLVGRFEIAVPERPRSALSRTVFIDRAPLALFPEDAVSVRSLAKADPTAHGMCVHEQKLFPGQFGTTGQAINLFVVEPDEALFSGATGAALGAGEGEAGVEPYGFGVISIRHHGPLDERRLFRPFESLSGSRHDDNQPFGKGFASIRDAWSIA